MKLKITTGWKTGKGGLKFGWTCLLYPLPCENLKYCKVGYIQIRYNIYNFVAWSMCQYQWILNISVMVDGTRYWKPSVRRIFIQISIVEQNLLKFDNLINEIIKIFKCLILGYSDAKISKFRESGGAVIWRLNPFSIEMVLARLYR